MIPLMIRIAEIVCPDGHPRASTLYDPATHTAEFARGQVEESHAKTKDTQQTCCICGKPGTTYQDRETEYSDFTEAFHAEKRRLFAHLMTMELQALAAGAARHGRN